jgi:hypothetical protein
MTHLANPFRSHRIARWTSIAGAIAAAAALAAACASPLMSKGEFSFFVTSAGVGNGADLGGLAGADAHCQKLATAAGATTKPWRAYLSTQGKDGAASVNARDRIGSGPWHNAKGELIAANADALHGSGNQINKQTALTETGAPVNGRGDTPNRHDILTGSRTDGTAFSSGDPDMTCGNWTRSGTEGVAVVGHHDRSGPSTDPWAVSWNSSHQSRGGCSQTALKGTGGDGLFYCFAAK